MNERDLFINEYSNVFKALSHPTRLSIVYELIEQADGLNVSTLQASLGISQSSVSQHLRILKQYNILESKRNGTEIKYILYNKKVIEILKLIKE